ncbi:MAG: GNAT family N-acetyltransferase [Actinobacteria bacterium]|nr:GNAT family N-acetyltransferase [Actinomycetota bacterium]
MTFPSTAVAAALAGGTGPPVVGTAWGVALVRDGQVLRNAGGGSTPGVLLDPDLPPFEREAAPAGATALVLHDVIDLDGVLAAVRAHLPDAQVVHRYVCRSCDFGTDPEAFADRHLSTKRRKRLRADRRKLSDLGAVEARWLAPDEAAAAWGRYHALLVDRVLDTGRWDATVADGDARRAWTATAGRELAVHALSVAGTPVSFRTGFVVGQRFLGLAPVAARDLSGVSLGDLHMRMLLDDLHARGATSYLLGKGDNEHKETWGTSTYDLSSVVVGLRDGTRSRAIVTAEVARQHLRRRVTERGWEHPLRRGLHRWASLTDRDYRAALRRRVAASAAGDGA